MVWNLLGPYSMAYYSFSESLHKNSIIFFSFENLFKDEETFTKR